MACRIDSHHHLWSFNSTEFDWIDDTMAVLRRDFLPSELECEATSAGVTATVVIQARQSIEETGKLLQVAQVSRIIRGVVGWLPIAGPDFADHLSRLRESKHFKGLRHVVQAEPAGFLSRSDFNRGIQAMQGSGLTYDLLIRQEQLQESIQFVDRYPNQLFVLDHLAKPAVGKGDLRNWASLIARLAERPNVVCKLSGLVTEAEAYRWSPASIAPYLDTALEAFGANRLMIGTDWPVLTVACSYGQWWETIESWCSPLSDAERASILGATANRVYGLEIEEHAEWTAPDQPGGTPERSIA